MEQNNLLKVDSLSISFQMYEKGTRQRHLQVISNLSVDVNEGEIVAIVGSSGSGKSLLADAILGLLPQNAHATGQILYRGEELTQKRVETLRGKEIAFIPQSVLNLDPMMRVGKQVIGIYGNSARQQELFEQYGLDSSVAQAYPHQLSGGMLRRVLIAGSIMNDAKLIIADEPTPGLSEELARRLMKDFEELAAKGYGILLITHDINLAVAHAKRIAVFYGGTTVEVTPTDDFRRGEDFLRHPYTKALWRALPQNLFQPISGVQPYAGTVEQGCLFAQRCPLRTKECDGEIPMKNVRDGEVRCIYAT